MPSLSENRQVPGVVIEVLYVEHCPNFPAALALVQRARLWARPRFESMAAMSIPKASWPPSTPWSVACTGMSIALPATRRSVGSVMRCCGQPVGPNGRMGVAYGGSAGGDAREMGLSLGHEAARVSGGAVRHLP